MDDHWRDAVSLSASQGHVDSTIITDLSDTTTCCCRGPTDAHAILFSIQSRQRSFANLLTLESSGATTSSARRGGNNRGGGGRSLVGSAPLKTPVSCCSYTSNTSAEDQSFVVAGSCTEPRIFVLPVDASRGTLGVQPSEINVEDLLSDTMATPSSGSNNGARHLPQKAITAVDLNEDIVGCLGVSSVVAAFDPTTVTVVYSESVSGRVVDVRWVGGGSDQCVMGALTTEGNMHLIDPRVEHKVVTIRSVISTEDSPTRLTSNPLIPYSVVTAGDILSVWDLRKSVTSVFSTPTLQVNIVAVSASCIRANIYATAAMDGSVKMWRSDRRVPILDGTPHDTYPVSLHFTRHSAFEAVISCGTRGDVVVQRMTPEFLGQITPHDCSGSLTTCREVETEVYNRNMHAAHELLPAAVAEARAHGAAEQGLKLLALCTKRLNPRDPAIAEQPLLDVCSEMMYYVPTTMAQPLTDVAEVEPSMKDTVDRLTMNMLLALYVQNKNIDAVVRNMDTVVASIKQGSGDVDADVVSECVALIMRRNYCAGVKCAERLILAVCESDSVDETLVNILHRVFMTAIGPLAVDDFKDSSSPFVRGLYSDLSAVTAAMDLVRKVVTLSTSKRDGAAQIINAIVDYEASVVESGAGVSVLAIPSLPLIMLYIHSLIHTKDIASFLWIACAYDDRYGSQKAAEPIKATLVRKLTAMQSSVTEVATMIRTLASKPSSNATAALDDMMVLLGKVQTHQAIFLRSLRCILTHQRSISADGAALRSVVLQLTRNNAELCDVWKLLLDRLRSSTTNVRRAAPAVAAHRTETQQMLSQIPLEWHSEDLDGLPDPVAIILDTSTEFLNLSK